jgi:hypothetical protein
MIRMIQMMMMHGKNESPKFFFNDLLILFRIILYIDCKQNKKVIYFLFKIYTSIIFFVMFYFYLEHILSFILFIIEKVGNQ